MQSQHRPVRRWMFAIIFTMSGMAAVPAFGQNQFINGITITAVAVNGGTDTVNPGTTCIMVSAPVSAGCSAGYLAIQNNNKELIAAALQARATGKNIWLYYEDAIGSYHCPGLVFTPCSVISISQ